MKRVLFYSEVHLQIDNVRCPFCGADSNEGVEAGGVIEPCPHMLYLHFFGEFHYLSSRACGALGLPPQSGEQVTAEDYPRRLKTGRVPPLRLMC